MILNSQFSILNSQFSIKKMGLYWPHREATSTARIA